MKFGKRIGAFARAHAGCSLHKKFELYREAVVPKDDRGTAFEKEYFDIRAPRTCALFAAQCLAAAEEEALAAGDDVNVDLVLEEHYKIGNAIAEDEFVGGQHHALELFTPFGGVPAGGQATMPTEPFAEGDIPIINGPPYGPHVIVCSGDVVVKDEATWEGPTVQGGQSDGGVEAFDTTWHVKHYEHGLLRLFAGNGARYVVAVIRARKFEYDDADTVASEDRIIGPADIAPARAPIDHAVGVIDLPSEHLDEPGDPSAA